MPVTLIIVGAAVVAAFVVWLLSSVGRDVDTIDPVAEERWLVAWLGRHPRWGRHVRAIDRRVAGGVMLLVGLTIVFATAVVIGAIADMVDRTTGLARWDSAVAEWGSEHATDASTAVLDVVTDLGGTVTVVAVAIAIAAADYLRNRNRDVVWFLAAVLAGNALINNLVKVVVGRARPDVPHLVETSSYSFPSGHAATAAAAWCAFALVLTRWRSRRARAGAAAAAALVTGAVAASRALLGVHWLTDVVAGVVMGWGWFLLCALAFGGRIQRLGDAADGVVADVVASDISRSSERSSA
jgi:membrane-associated phospholipid phosphatase